MRKLLLLSLLVLFGCSKNDDSTEASKVTFLERFDKTSWLRIIPDDKSFYYKDGVDDRYIYSFLNTTKIYDMFFYRDIASEGLVNENTMDIEEGYCTNVGYPPNFHECGYNDTAFNYDLNTYEILKNTSVQLRIKKYWWICVLANDGESAIGVENEDWDENGIEDFSIYDFTYSALSNTINFRVFTDASAVIPYSTDVLTEIDLTWRENYDRCSYVHRKLRGRY